MAKTVKFSYVYNRETGRFDKITQDAIMQPIKQEPIQQDIIFFRC